MSKTKVGWVRHDWDSHAGSWIEYHGRDSCTVRVLVTEIEDESLPYPGDGKVWEHCGSKVEVLTAPVGNSKRVFVRSGAVDYGVMATQLRERKPEPGCKHCGYEGLHAHLKGPWHARGCPRRYHLPKPAPEPEHNWWCALAQPRVVVGGCTCERRRGERRKE